MKKKLFHLAVFGMACAASAAQPKALQTYSGDFEYGKATYTYTLNEKGERVYEGNFRYADYSTQAEGRFKNGRKNGLWTYRTADTRIEANYKEGVRHGSYTYRRAQTQNRHALNIDLTFANGQLTGKASISGEILYCDTGALTGQTDAQGHADGEWTFDTTSSEETVRYRTVYSHGDFVRSSVHHDATGRTEQQDAGVAYLVGFAVRNGTSTEEIGGGIVPWDEDVLLRNSAPDATAASEAVYMHVEEMPEFPGGAEALRRYINKRLPFIEPGCGMEARTIVQVVVRRDGAITDVKIARGVDQFLDAEAIRIAKGMPKWKPGRHNGKAANVMFFFPIMWKTAH